MRTVSKKEIKVPRAILIRKMKKYSAVYLLFLPTLLFYFVYKYIPMFGNINSLNASVAAAVLMYEISRQRQGDK